MLESFNFLIKCYIDNQGPFFEGKRKSDKIPLNEAPRDGLSQSARIMSTQRAKER